MPDHKALIKHGLFRYHVPEQQVINGEDKELLIERSAFHNEEVTLTRDSDYERGMRFGAFWTREQALAHYEALGVPAPLLSQSTSMPQPQAVDVEPEEVEITDLDEDDLVDWLMGTGQFDGQTKPTVAQVLEAAQEGGPEFAGILEAAEVRASGDAPRQGVIDGLEKVKNATAA